MEKNTTLTISGADKVKIGDFAALVRRQREPEPYKGKGIRYQGEIIKLKEGKVRAQGVYLQSWECALHAWHLACKMYSCVLTPMQAHRKICIVLVPLV